MFLPKFLRSDWMTIRYPRAFSILPPRKDAPDPLGMHIQVLLQVEQVEHVEGKRERPAQIDWPLPLLLPSPSR